MATEPVRVRVPTRVTLGRTEKVVIVENQVAGTYRYVIGIDTDAIFSSLYVETVNSGTLDISVITYSGDYSEDKVAEVFSFPTLSAPTGELILKKGAAVMSWVEFVVTSTGTTSYELYVKGVSSGESTVKISGSTDAVATAQGILGGMPVLLIPISLTDRSGLIVKNYTSGGILYIGFSSAQANPSTGYPLIYGESMGMDLAGGATLYGYGTTPIDVRVIEGGG